MNRVARRPAYYRRYIEDPPEHSRYRRGVSRFLILQYRHKIFAITVKVLRESTVEGREPAAKP